MPKRYTSAEVTEGVLDILAAEDNPQKLDHKLREKINRQRDASLEKEFFFNFLEIVQATVELQRRFNIKLPDNLEEYKDITANTFITAVENALRNKRLLLESGETNFIDRVSRKR